MAPEDAIRELEKIHDVFEKVMSHFWYEAQMNAALHMNSTVRAAPLATATMTAVSSLEQLMNDLRKESGIPTMVYDRTGG